MTDDRAAAIARAQAALKRASATIATPRAAGDSWSEPARPPQRAQALSKADRPMASNQFVTHETLEFVADALVDIHNTLVDDTKLLTDENNSAIIDIVADIEKRFEARIAKLEQEIRNLNASAKTDEGIGDAH